MHPLLNQGKMDQLTEIPKSTAVYVGSVLPREKPMCLTEEKGSGYSSSLALEEQMSSTGLYSSLLLVLRQGFAKLSMVTLNIEDRPGLPWFSCLRLPSGWVPKPQHQVHLRH